MSIIHHLASISPRQSAPDGLRDSGPFLDGDPAVLAAASDGAGLITAGALGAVALLVGAFEFLFVTAGIAIGTTAALRGGLVAVASARESRALGSAPTLVGRAVLRTRIAPTAEGAAAFAAETDGALGERLTDHVRHARSGPRSGLRSFAGAWRNRFPALYRSLTLVEAATGAAEAERDRTLDRAMDTILDGTRERAATAADNLRGPATALYAFGVLLPLALVAVLPAAGAAGIQATFTAVVVVYDLVLPVGLLCASGWLVANRPVVFPPAPVGRDHPDVPTRRWPPLVVGGIAAVVGWLLAGHVVAPWTRPIAAVGFGAGVMLVAACRPIVLVRRRADRLDEGLPDALYLVGRRVADGISVERAVANAAAELDDEAGVAFTAAARRQRQLRVGIETAFTGTDGDGGALSEVPSGRAESAARLLGVAAREGPPAGRALVETADHLDDLRRVEATARRDLAQVTSTLGNTAAFFGPLVGGATVALADGVGTASTLDGGTPETSALGVAIGIYVLCLAAILTTLATGLSRGLDRATVGYRVGGALCAATATFLVGFRATGGVAGGL